jgi:hypothetical protein
MTKIAFHIYHFTFRGTEIAVFDYALFNREILKNESIIVVPYSQSQPVNEDVKKKFQSEFNIFLYTDVLDLERIIKEQSADALYVIKSGGDDNMIVRSVPVFVHCVFTTDEPHGTVYAGVSRSVSKGNRYPVVNHMVYLPDIKTDFRDDLGIPRSSKVFGRHGGADTFDLPFVKKAILEYLNEEDIGGEGTETFFLFAIRPDMMIDIWHPRIIYLDSFTDMRIKTKFINTCDAMIHGCSMGESFGLSVLEFCHQNKPVITWTGGSLHREHHSNLGSKGIYYDSIPSLKKLMKEFSPLLHTGIDYKSIVAPFSPHKIMKSFNEVFLSRID